MTATPLTELLTCVGGGTVVLSTRRGDVEPGTITGVFHGDRRVLSDLRLTVTGHTLTLLAVHTPAADRVLTHHLVAGDGGQRALLTRDRSVRGQVEERIVIRALGAPVTLDVRLDVAADFANLHALRGFSDEPPHPAPLRPDAGDLVAAHGETGVRVTAEGATVEHDGEARAALGWTVSAGAGAPAVVGVAVRPQPEQRGSRPRTPRLRVDGPHPWRRVITRAVEDLDALRIDTPARGLSYVAAGAPWYMALFGRDALLTAFEAMLLGPGLALDTLEALRTFQGTTTDPATGEEPGKILHELRTGSAGIFGLDPWQPYYGTVDATPLFVMLLAEAYRWGAPADRVRDLLPAARAAITWCEINSLGDPHGFLTHPTDQEGLRNQGWKDSDDAMVHADGRRADGPIALVEVQAYHWRALRDLAALETALGDAAAAPGLTDRADRMRAAIAREFWNPRRRLLAMAIDGTGAPLEVASSNAGHALWTAALDRPTGEAVAAMLAAPASNAGWGIRTLGADERAYDPMSYHRGSIWPHDSALVVDGMARYGRRAEAAALIEGLLDAAEHHGWRLPELYGGYGRDEVPVPVPYPVACSPQAWSAVAPLQLLRTVLGLAPDVPAGAVTAGPALMDVSLRLEGVRLAHHDLDITVRSGDVDVRAEPPLTRHHGRR